MIDLSGQWALSDDSGSYRTLMQVPGDGVSALARAGMIPDPYWGRNEYDCRWVAERDWVATRSFTVDRTDLALEIDMLDTVAEVFVNGQSVLKAENMFRRYVAGLSSALKMGENEISIRFASPVREGAKRQAEMPFFVPYAAQNCPIPNGNMLRKPACDFGWDWNIALAPFGIYGDIRLIPEFRPELYDIKIRQKHAGNRVTVSIRAMSFNVTAATVTLCGQTQQMEFHDDHAWASFTIENPSLWWPAGQGQQPLHDLFIRYGDVETVRRIGFRSVELVTEKDAAGTGFKFRVNGHDVFAKGANWIPADALASNITPEATRGLLQSAVDANMNMIRVWGGGRYEPDWFYDLCDELGLLVWQDFMFACNLYPSTGDFLAEVFAEVVQNVGRLHHHACIALWCGDNELIGALTWFPESRANRDRFLVSYDRLNRTIEQALEIAAPGSNWWPSSPSPGPMSFADAWHDDRSGDMHFWSVWHEGKDFDHYRDVSPRFCSEFGFQSYPSMSVIRKFADPKDWNIASPVMESHQKNAGGNARIAETMFRYFRFPVDFPNFVYLSQVQQGLAIKTAVTHWRSLKPHCMGTLYWQLNDTWPVCSWSSLDYGGNWKLLHHMARQFYAPVVVVAVPDGNAVKLCAVRDLRDSIDLIVAVHAVRMDGTSRALGKHGIDVGPDAAVDVVRIGVDTLGQDEILAFTWTGGDGLASGDIHAPHPWKSYDLQPPRIVLSEESAGTDTILTVKSEALALFVALESDVPGRFSRNAFALFPGFPATVTFTPDDAAERPRFIVRDLHSATYGQEA